jgi:hypothetical protein
MSRRNVVIHGESMRAADYHVFVAIEIDNLRRAEITAAFALIVVALHDLDSDRDEIAVLAAIVFGPRNTQKQSSNIQRVLRFSNDPTDCTNLVVFEMKLPLETRAEVTVEVRLRPSRIRRKPRRAPNARRSSMFLINRDDRGLRTNAKTSSRWGKSFRPKRLVNRSSLRIRT